MSQSPTDSKTTSGPKHVRRAPEPVTPLPLSPVPAKVTEHSPLDHSQVEQKTAIVPPIRSLSTRVKPKPPSTATLRQGDSTAESPPAKQIKSKVSTTIRNTISELQRLLNDALAESEIKVGEAVAEASEQDEKKQTHFSSDSRLNGRLPTAEKEAEATLQGRRSTPQLSTHFQGSLNEDTSKLLKTSSTQKQEGDKLKLPEKAHLRDLLTKATLAPSKLSHPGDFELGDLKVNHQRQSEERSGQLDHQNAEQHDNRKLRLRASHSKNLRFKPPFIAPRASSVQREALTEDTRPLITKVPALRLNDQALIEEGQDAVSVQSSKLSGACSDSSVKAVFSSLSNCNSVDFSDVPLRKPTAKIDLKRKSHVDILNLPLDFNVHESHDHASVARGWPNSRKRFTACVACVNTSCIGLLLGIYAGEVPAIQYVIADINHNVILGNVVFYLGLAIPSLLCWPLPLLHGRKVYLVGSMLIAMALQVPQGLAVSGFRSPDVVTYRCLLLISRAVSGLALGFSDMNLYATLLDLYGASLQSQNPHSASMDPYDVRRHGGGMGSWLGFWCWCSIGSISLGFMVGASIINQGASVTWGFWTGLIVLVAVLLINIISPEVRRSAFRRTIAQFVGEDSQFSRITRGEIKMHVRATGPYWWGEELVAGLELCSFMLKQPGFLILSVYIAWVYAQFTLILMLLGALASKHYNLRPVHVGLCALSLAIGALLANPFQKASWLSRARTNPPRTDSMTIQKSCHWSSHLARRSLFTLLLPAAAVAYTGASIGPPLTIAIPCLMAGLVGFLSNLAITECYSLILETFDTSDLQPGMTGRPNNQSVVAKFATQRTNFSCYPRVSAGIAITQALKYALGAAATGICGRMERHDGTVFTTGVVAGILLGLSALMILVTFRWKEMQMIPAQFRTEKLRAQRKGTLWEPVVLGKPTGTTRKLSILELGEQSRWSEIRRKNRLDSRLTGDFR